MIEAIALIAQSRRTMGTASNNVRHLMLGLVIDTMLIYNYEQLNKALSYQVEIYPSVGTLGLGAYVSKGFCYNGRMDLHINKNQFKIEHIASEIK